MKFLGFFVEEASLVTDIEDVFVASSALFFRKGSISENILFFVFSSSVAASIISSQDLKLSISSTIWIFSRVLLT